MAFVKTENTGRKNLGDVILHVEAIDLENKSLIGVDLRTGEGLTVSLAGRDEIAKYFSARNDTRTYEERLAAADERIKRRPDATVNGKVQEGSVVRLENTRSYPVEDGVKNVAIWPEALARDPTREAVVIASVEANIRNDGKPFLKLYDDANPKSIAETDFETAFNGDFKGFPMATSGVTVVLRDDTNRTITSTLLTDFRTKAAPSIESALSSGGGLGRYEVIAAAVVAAATGRSFDDLKISPNVPSDARENARLAFDDIVSGAGKFEVVVVPAATAQFIPTHAEPDFLKKFHGTEDGKADPSVSPDPSASYSGKGVVHSVLSVSLHPSNNDAPVSVRSVQPVNGYEFTNQPERKVYVAMEEVLVQALGSTHGSATPEEPKGSRNMSSDPAP